MSDTSIFFIMLFFIITFLGSGILTLFQSCIACLGPLQTKELFLEKKKLFFFYNKIFKPLFSKNTWNKFLLVINISKQIFVTLAAIFAFSFCLGVFIPIKKFFIAPAYFFEWFYFSLAVFSIIAIFLSYEFIMRFISKKWTLYYLQLIAPFASIYLLIFFPITSITAFLSEYFPFFHIVIKDLKNRPMAKEKIIETLKDTGVSDLIDPSLQEIITSLVTFKDKVAREIMIPRVDMFSLQSTVTIREAAKYSLEENYSRIPVYKDSLDTIIGVVMYKDLFKAFIRNELDSQKNDLLDIPLDAIIKPVIYAPENKKISNLFQEFCSKQTHLAIIVDEYGSTKGIVTIEDVLEELVGEIQDEYDTEEGPTFWKLDNGSWIVDAKMSIVDIENKLHIQIPNNPEYETIGGYVFHRAGTIPTKGWSIHHNNFDLEVLISNERCIEKVRITAIKGNNES